MQPLMKKIFYYSLLALFLLTAGSCTKGLEEININEVNPTSLDASLLLNNAIINTSYPTKTVMFDMGIVQQMVTPNGGVLAGANFNQDNRNPTGPIWQAYYRNVIRNTRDVIEHTKSVATRSNLMNMARIIQAYAFMILTDTYGDIPYSEAGQG